MRIRREPREAGTCLADGCGLCVLMVDRLSVKTAYFPRGFCRDHARERDLELSVRNASGRTAEVLHLSDYRRSER